MSAGRILVVDDESDIRGLLKEILSEEGYEVEVAGNGAQARERRAARAETAVHAEVEASSSGIPRPSPPPVDVMQT